MGRLGCKVSLVLFLWATPSLAQQQPDVTTLQRTIAILQQHRNQAMDALAATEVQRALLAEEIEKLKARIAELEKTQKQ